MTLANYKKLNAHIFRLLKVNEIIYPIARTSKGNFGLRFTPNSEDYEMYLDAVPLPTKSTLEDDNNIELKKVLEKYLFEPSPMTVDSARSVAVKTGGVIEKFSNTKRGGRPKGSKNKK